MNTSQLVTLVEGTDVSGRTDVLGLFKHNKHDADAQLQAVAPRGSSSPMSQLVTQASHCLGPCHSMAFSLHCAEARSMGATQHNTAKQRKGRKCTLHWAPEAHEAMQSKEAS